MNLPSYSLVLLSLLLCPLSLAGDSTCPMTLQEENYPLVKEEENDYQPSYNSFKERLSNVWHSPHSSIILPVNTYHSRDTYTREQIRNYNEMPWGLGVGKWYRDSNNTRHQLIFMGFADSHSKVQLIASYTWQKDIFLNDAQTLLFGYGCDFFITARDDYFYIPFPGLTPLASLQYKNFAVSTSWVPWLGSNYGNVLLTTVRWYF